MNDHDALLHAIGEHPEEDTPRLMYADWLEENDQPERADFVRNQVEMAHIGLDDPARGPHVLKNAFYLNYFVPAWKAELPRLSKIEWSDFNRGLMEEFEAASEEPLIKHAAIIFAVPGIHILRLKRLTDAPKLARLPQLARLRGLKMVSANVDQDALRTLLASPYLGKLTILDLHGNNADDTVISDIVDGRFPDLAELWLGSNRIGNRGVMTLAGSPHLKNLRFLDLFGYRRRINHETRVALKKRFGAGVKL